MKISVTFIILCVILISCETSPKNEFSSKTINPLSGTWKLLSGTTIEKDSATVTDYTKDKEFIKIINETHFAFLSHDLKKGKDSSIAAFSSGGGSYLLNDSLYTENLEYCSDRQWEGNKFPFTITIKGDTLIQKGVEKIENIGVDRINIEKYIKMKS